MTSTEIAQYRTSDGNIVGLDEIDAGDMVTPRFQINHDKGVWVNTQTKMEYTEFTAILLCRVKQRIMWKEKLVDNADPRCRSNEFNIGFPNRDPKSAPADLFPWERSVFNPDDYPADPNHNGLSVLPCASCDFKNWHGDDKPECREQWTFAAEIFLATPSSPNGEWCPALLTIQGTGLPSVKPYISTFIQSQKPLFTQMTQVTLKSEVKVNKTYYVPVFSPGAGTAPETWPGYEKKTLNYVTYLKQDPRPYERDENAPAVAPTPEPEPIAAPAPETVAPVVSAPAPAPEPVVEPEIHEAEIVEEPPVSIPAPAPVAPVPAAPAPAQPAVAAPAPAQPAPAAPAPVAAPAPAVAPAAPAPAAAPAAPVAAAPAASSPPTVAPGKLPF